MAAQARDGAGATAVDPRASRQRRRPPTATGARTARSRPRPADAIVEAGRDRLGRRARARCSAKTRGYRGRLALTFGLGIARVTALIGVGVLSALAVRAVTRGEPAGTLLVALVVVAPLAGVLHWLESWLAHDVAYRLLTDMRLAVFRKLDALAPAYLTRRRTGDLAGVATHDVELIEYFFAHTVTPALVAVLVPAAVLVTLGGLRAAAGARAGAVPALHRARPGARSRADRPAQLARARGVGRSERARGRHRAGARRDRRVRARARVGRGAGGQGPALLSTCGCRSCATSRGRPRSRRRPPGSAVSR